MVRSKFRYRRFTWDVVVTAYPEERLGCHNHVLGVAGDAVVAGWAGLTCGK
jgi:hypothetical protein